jgi:hypothetical protein
MGVGCELGADGVPIIVQLLRNNRTLTSMHIGDNKFGSSGLDAILEALQSNPSITSFRIEGTQLIEPLRLCPTMYAS